MKCKRLAVTLLSTVSLAGCGIKTVYVPVSSCPQPPALTMPLLATESLALAPKGQKPTPEQTSSTIRAMALDHVTLKKTLEQCIISLDAYRTPTP